MDQEKTRGRKCSICLSPHRAVLESEVLGEGRGEAVSHIPPMTEVAARHGVGPHALRRHMRNHVGARVRAELEPREGLDAATVMSRALALANEVRNLRWQAVREGNHRDAIRSIESETKVLSLLAVRLGVDAENTVQVVAEAERLAKAVGQVSRDQPDLGGVIAAELRAQGANEMADALLAEMRRKDGKG